MKEIIICDDVRKRFPDLRAFLILIKDVHIENTLKNLEEFKKDVFDDVKRRYSLHELKDVAIFRAYRDFFWEIGVDPTKTRPASEALIRRILQGKQIPSVNTLVDAYNLASIVSEVPLAAFDYQTLQGELLMRFAQQDGEFVGIGMKEVKLKGNEIVISDSKKVIAIYPHRDSDETKITTETKDVLLMVCGAPGVGEDILNKARDIAVGYIRRFCGGQVV